MIKRYAVSDGQRTFAFVHATNIADAIHIACEQAPDHNPENCTATPICDVVGRGSSGRLAHPTLPLTSCG